MTQARQFGHYELLSLLGQGGMGEVWRAKHRLLNRQAAVKLIRTEALSAEGGAEMETSLRRFEREAQATSALQSPHTVQIYDFGITDDGTFYYAMELLDGLDLQTLVDRYGPLPSERVIHILLQVCESLAEAHYHELIHRDLKPANVFLTRRSLKQDVVKVLDFGLVKSTGGLAADVGLLAALREAAEGQKHARTTLVFRAHEQSVMAGAFGAALWGAFRYRMLERKGVSLAAGGAA